MIQAMKTTETLGQRLVRNLDLIRESRKLDAESFAKESGVSPQLASLWRTGKRNATLTTLERTALNLGVKASSLLSDNPLEVLEGEVRS